ncbi:hypothetical protein JOS77_04335 [Chromobacterium haemolyticum]|nr:hypothetical protein JOS77_04335 [Chromobacterium haemolyticum]
MSLESGIASLVTASTELTATVRGKTAEIDAKVAAKIAELEQWRVSARSEYPAINILANTGFVDSNNDGVPDGWAYSSFNYNSNPPGAVTLVSSKLVPASDYPSIKGLGAVYADNLLRSVKVWVLELANDASVDVCARVSSKLKYPLPRNYSAGVMMRTDTTSGAKPNAGVGGGSFYEPTLKYDEAKGGWQWVTGQVMTFEDAFCVNVIVPAKTRCTWFLALPMAVDGYCDRAIL